MPFRGPSCKVFLSFIYKGSSNPNTTCHMWHYKTEDGVLHVHSGTIIQKDIWTMASLHSSSPAFLWVYNHALLAKNKKQGCCGGNVQGDWATSRLYLGPIHREVCKGDHNNLERALTT